MHDPTHYSGTLERYIDIWGALELPKRVPYPLPLGRHLGDELILPWDSHQFRRYS